MKTIVLRVDAVDPAPAIIGEAGRVIQDGGLVAFPTETVYGLAADAFNEDAVSRVYEVKGRPENKPLPVQVATRSDVARLTAEISNAAARLMEAFFPGPLTIIFRAAERVPRLVTAGTGKIGIRMPDHPVAIALIRSAGTPIVAPSANPSGLPPPSSAVEVYEYLNGQINVILDSGPSRLKIASTVVDMSGDEPIILRQGTITEEELISCIRG